MGSSQIFHAYEDELYLTLDSDNEKNLIHRENAPAIEWSDGENWWVYNGEKHREDGPAEEWDRGYFSWYYHGERIYCHDN